MKHVCVFMLLICLFLSSCNTYEKPLGIWRSEDGKITLYIDDDYVLPGYRAYYCCSYIHDGYEDKAYAKFAGWAPTIVVSDIYDQKQQRNVMASRQLLVGLYKEEEGSLVVDVRSQEGKLYKNVEKVIVFNELTDYEPIDPEDWISEITTPSGLQEE